MGDYHDDDRVDIDDYAEWRSSYGASGPNLAADGNNNGVVDQGDLVIWNGLVEQMSCFHA
jgi:hypothetical protein